MDDIEVSLSCLETFNAVMTEIIDSFQFTF